MENTKYNGWTNYATWRVNLECFDCAFEPCDYWDDYATLNISELADRIKDNAEEYIFSIDRQEGTLMEQYARAFLSDVNWYEIAQSIIDAYPQTEEQFDKQRAEV